MDEYLVVGFGFKYKYLFGKIGMWMKLVLENLVGMVIVYYMLFEIDCYDEMDFEFLGNVLG